MRPAEARVRVAGAETRLVVFPGRIAAIQTRKGEIFGVYVRKLDGDVHRVEILRAPADGEPRTLARPDFLLLETFLLGEGASAARSVSPDVVLEVALPMGGIKEIEINEDDEAGCCVTCDNGVVICGSRVRSSCGSCG